MTRKRALKHNYQKRVYDSFLKTLEGLEKNLDHGKIKSMHGNQVKLQPKKMIGSGEKEMILSNIPAEQQNCAQNIIDKFLLCTD